jgi:RNA polymerase sigma factor (sigma-70 family)
MNRDPKQVLTEWLVLSAQDGNEASFKELHDLWRADLRRLCLAHVERGEAVNEILNEVWLAIARGLPRLDDPACFPRWAFRIVDRRSADWIRKRRLDRRREIAAANEAEQLAPAAAEKPEPSEQIIHLRNALSRLPADQRSLVQLYYEAERSVGEIADALAIPEGTVKSRLFALRESLRQMLERKPHE